MVMVGDGGIGWDGVPVRGMQSYAQAFKPLPDKDDASKSSAAGAPLQPLDAQTQRSVRQVTHMHDEVWILGCIDYLH